MKTLIIALFSFASLTSAQDAIVVDVGAANAAKMKQLYGDKARIEAEIKSETRRIGNLYAKWETGSAIDKDGRVPPPYKFSEDFHYIVPDPPESNTSRGITLGDCGNFRFNPAAGRSQLPIRTWSSAALGYPLSNFVIAQ